MLNKCFSLIDIVCVGVAPFSLSLCLLSQADIDLDFPAFEQTNVVVCGGKNMTKKKEA